MNIIIVSVKHEPSAFGDSQRTKMKEVFFFCVSLRFQREINSMAIHLLELPLELQLEVFAVVVEDLVEACADGAAVEVAGAADFGDELKTMEDGELEEEGCADTFVVETAHTKGVEQAGLVGIDASVVIFCVEIG